MSVSTKTKNINTVYLGKQVCVQIEEVKNTGSIPAQDTYVEVSVPEGLSFDVANTPAGTYDPVTNRWNIGTLLPSQQYTGELCFTVTDECLSAFKFEFKVGSSSTCTTCTTLAVQCLNLIGQSCCEIDNCGFSKFGSVTFDLPCPDSLPTTPTSPPSNPIDEQYHIEFYQNCEAWFQYDAENEIWNVVNGITVGSGTISSVTRIVNGNPIALHDNNAGTSVYIDETVTGFTDLVSGNKIATYTREDGAPVEINETLTSLGNLIAGNKIGDFTREDGVVQDIDETITSITNLNSGKLIGRYVAEDGVTYNIDETITSVIDTIGGHLIGRYVDELGTPQDIDETITSVSENADGTYTYTKEDGTTDDFGPQYAAGYVTDVSVGTLGEATVPFPFTFTSAPIVVATVTNPAVLYFPTITSVSTTQFTVRFNAMSGTLISFNWVAMPGVQAFPSPTPTSSVTPSITPTSSVAPTVTPTPTPTPTITPSTSPP